MHDTKYSVPLLAFSSFNDSLFFLLRNQPIPVVLFLLPGITVLLSLTVFMLMVAEIMPATSDSVPLIGQFGSVYTLPMCLWVFLFFWGGIDTVPTDPND